MAVISEGLVGAFSGRVGQVVGYRWKHTQCIRAYVAQVRYPNTEAQQRERDWFVSMVRFAAQARNALKLGMTRGAQAAGMTEGNYFVKLNKQHFSLEDGQVQVNYDRLVIAQGAATDVYFHEPRFEEHETVTVAFEKNGMSLRASGEDRVYLYVYAPSVGRGYLSAPAMRRSKRLSVSLPAEWAGLEVHLYGFVVDKEGRASGSTYIGVGRVNHYEVRGHYIPLNKNWNDFVDIANEANAESEAAEPAPPKQQGERRFDLFADPPKVP